VFETQTNAAAKGILFWFSQYSEKHVHTHRILCVEFHTSIYVPSEQTPTSNRRPTGP